MAILKIRDEFGKVREILVIKGDPGYTPQKGLDYYTEADKAKMIADVLAALPNGDEVSY